MKFFPAALIFFFLLTGISFSQEWYSIDNQPVLMYKIINYWYDAPGDTASFLCGRPVSCRIKSDTTLKYTPQDRQIILFFPQPVADQLSIAEPPKTAKALWAAGPFHMNSSLLDSCTAMVTLTDSGNLKQIVLSPVLPDLFRELQTGRLEVMIEGRIFGLKNGRIALHPTKNLIRKCQKSDNPAPVTIRIVDTVSKKTIAELKIPPDIPVK